MCLVYNELPPENLREEGLDDGHLLEGRLHLTAHDREEQQHRHHQHLYTTTIYNNIHNPKQYKGEHIKMGTFPYCTFCEGMFCEGDVLNMRRFVKVDVWHKGKLRIEEDVVLRGTFCV